MQFVTTSTHPHHGAHSVSHVVNDDGHLVSDAILLSNEDGLIHLEKKTPTVVSALLSPKKKGLEEFKQTFFKNFLQMVMVAEE